MAAKTITDAYLIRCVSHMHAGSGDTEYGIVDKLVQRDPSTGWPTVNGSSMKGALREFYEFFTKTVRADFVPKVFGAGTQDEEKSAQAPKDNKAETSPGSFDFDSAFLLYLPIRSDRAPHVLVTCPAAVHQFLERMALFGMKAVHSRLADGLGKLLETPLEQPVVSRADLNQAVLETFEHQVQYMEHAGFKVLEEIAGGRPVGLVSNELFGEFTKALPVIARNFLDNGESKNLWYEEVVPRDSIFYTIVSKGVEDGLAPLFDKLLVGEEKKLVQIGANATVGYGKCAFTKLGGQPS